MMLATCPESLRQQAEAARLDAAIWKNLKELGYVGQGTIIKS